jgi:hypothetical protein
MGENICQLYIKQGTDNQNIKGAQKTKLLQKINHPMKKWANDLNFFKGRSPKAKKHMKNAHHLWP